MPQVSAVASAMRAPRSLAASTDGSSDYRRSKTSIAYARCPMSFAHRPDPNILDNAYVRRVVVLAHAR
jgi:hypothetical protein